MSDLDNLRIKECKGLLSHIMDDNSVHEQVLDYYGRIEQAIDLLEEAESIIDRNYVNCTKSRLDTAIEDLETIKQTFNLIGTLRAAREAIELLEKKQ